MTTISEMRRRAYKTSVASGFHAKDPSPHDREAFEAKASQRIALIHSEVSEALEELRDGNWATYYRESDGKPEGVPSELADILIRVGDFAEAHGIDLEAAVEEKMAFNAKRPAMHGRKF